VATGTGNEFCRYYTVLFKRNQVRSVDTGLKRGSYLTFRHHASYI
jgi:hypothetical protein